MLFAGCSLLAMILITGLRLYVSEQSLFFGIQDLSGFELGSCGFQSLLAVTLSKIRCLGIRGRQSL